MMLTRFLTKLVTNYGKVIAAVALLITSSTVNSACMWVTYQPELPENAKKLRKF